MLVILATDGAGCCEQDAVRKLTEIVAATVLCGELSLGAAIVAEEWVRAHVRAQPAVGPGGHRPPPTTSIGIRVG